MHRGSHRSLCDGGESELNMLNRTRIGFDRTIRAEWLDAAAAHIANGDSADAARKFLWDFLEDVERGNTNNSGRGKTLTVLTRIWISVPEKSGALKRAALKQIATARVEQRIAIHWAMTAGTHPILLRCSDACWQAHPIARRCEPYANQTTNDRDMGRPINIGTNDTARTSITGSMGVCCSPARSVVHW